MDCSWVFGVWKDVCCGGWFVEYMVGVLELEVELMPDHGSVETLLLHLKFRGKRKSWLKRKGSGVGRRASGVDKVEMAAGEGGARESYAFGVGAHLAREELARRRGTVCDGETVAGHVVW
ncbi:hypothetical protein Droror1_Dr00012190 [Drosera rotundifolia]